MLLLIVVVAGLSVAIATYYATQRVSNVAEVARISRFSRAPRLSDRSWLATFVEPFAPVVERYMPGHYLAQIRERLRMAGYYGAKPFQLYLGSQALLAVLFAFVGALFGGRLALIDAVCAGAFGFMYPSLWLGAKVRKRQAAIENVLSDSVDLLTACVEAGLGLDAAIAQLVRRQSANFEAINHEFMRYLQELQVGLSRPEALKHLAERCGVEDLRQVVTALIHGDALGVGVSQILRAQTQHLRMRRKQRAEERAMKAPIKILFPLLFGIFPSIFVLVLGPAAIQLLDAFGGRLH
ncbi:MAG TPA: type II secretion system F family protein [Oscillatoriaceae cyanobacterium]